MRIGILGGTFDPIHNGHIALAQSALKELELNRLYFVPAKISPLKNQRPASETHRVNMIRTILKIRSQFRICLLELNRTGPSYTITTLKQFRKGYPRAELFFVMGDDSLKTFKQWKDWRKIIQICYLVIGKREKTISQSSKIEKQLLQRVVWLKARMPEVSSTAIRKYIINKKFHKVPCPSPVLKYILKQNLYVPTRLN